MDIVGPLTPSTSRHIYILVIIDYATHYPEAIPLYKIRTETVAKERALLFSRAGFPKQAVTGPDTTFMSETMKAMWHLVGVQPMRKSVYHPQMYGLV